MAVYFLDTSAIAKRYIQETGTSWIQSLSAPSAGHALFMVRITLAEMVAAITRRERGGSIAPPAAEAALADFQYDFIHQYFIVEVSAPLISNAATLARKHAMRGYDAVQLAAALELKAYSSALTFSSADGDFNAAAKAEGHLAEDPTLHP